MDNKSKKFIENKDPFISTENKIENNRTSKQFCRVALRVYRLTSMKTENITNLYFFLATKIAIVSSGQFGPGIFYHIACFLK